MWLLIKELIIDCFAGAGGASTGIELAIGRPVDHAINHNALALACHAANHPHTKHHCEDIRKAKPLSVTSGKPVGLAWFSPDCTHFSRAKGGKPVKKSIRGLAWMVIRWAREVKPRVIVLENVAEFQTWGPLTEDNRPCPQRKGQTFRRWLRQLRNLGYQVEYRELCAADYGSPTSRKRFFLIARCDGQPIMWPEPTHGPGRPKPWRTAAECIDWSLPCPSIFERKQPLAENTLRRIARGIQRFVIENPNPFIVQYHNPKREGDYRVASVNDPLPTQTTENRFGLVTPFLAPLTHQGSDRINSVEQPMPTVTAAHRGETALISPVLVGIDNKSSGDGAAWGAEKPLNTITQENRFAVAAPVLIKHYGGVVGHGVDRPAGTITAKDHHGLAAAFLTKYQGTSTGSQMDLPIPTITGGGFHIGEVRAFLVKYYGCGVGQRVTEPLHTITSKDRLGLVTVRGVDYQIVDIGLRMLQPRELARAQGFPEKHLLIGTKSQQVAGVGNSVPPDLAEAIVRVNYAERSVVEGVA